jgi:RNA 2',3'-cyclic 3'-phosphodiesterase
LMSFRAFIAIDVDCGPELRKAIGELKDFGKALKPVSPDNVHVTLKFLGEINESAVPKLETIIHKTAMGMKPFNVRLVSVGVFPNLRGPRVVWVGMEGAEPMIKMASVLEEGCEHLGFPKERKPFSPHLTLARVREGFKPDLADFIKDSEGREFGVFPVKGIKMKKSVLTPAGPIYSDVLTVDL